MQHLTFFLLLPGICLGVHSYELIKAVKVNLFVVKKKKKDKNIEEEVHKQEKGVHKHGTIIRWYL